MRVAAVRVLAAGAILTVTSFAYPMGQNISTLAVGLGVFEVGIAYHLWRDSQFYAARLESRSLVACVLKSVCALVATQAVLNAANKALLFGVLQAEMVSPQGLLQAWIWLPLILAVGGFFLASPLGLWIESRLVGDAEIQKELDESR